jgi:hypothetical protein
MNLRAIFALSIIAAAGFYVFTLRRLGKSILKNGSFEDGNLAGGFGQSSTRALSNGSQDISDWVAVGGITWSQQQASGFGPQHGGRFVNLNDKGLKHVFGAIRQSIFLESDKDYELELYAGGPPSKNPADNYASRMVKKLKRVEIAQFAAFHRLTSNSLLRPKNSVYNFAFNGW